MSIQARSFYYGVIHFDKVLEAIEEFKNDRKWWNITCGALCGM